MIFQEERDEEEKRKKRQEEMSRVDAQKSPGKSKTTAELVFFFLFLSVMI